MKENVELNMTCYYLLRNNKESGPYSFEELVKLPLQTTDLIWVNGESTFWRRPCEIEDLQGVKLVEVPPVMQPKKATPASNSQTAFTNETKADHSLYAAADAEEYNWHETPVEKPSFEALRNKYAANAPKKKAWKNQISIGTNLIGIATLVIGVSVAAFMIKKAVENIQPDPIVATADAREIESVNVQYLSTTNQAAMAPVMTASAVSPAAEEIETVNSSTENRNASAEEINKPAVEKKQDVDEGKQEEKTILIPVPQQAVSKNEETEKIVAKDIPVKPALEKETTAPEKTTTKEPAEDESKQTAKDEDNNDEENKTSKPKLQVTANEYKVGFLGGVSNLELSVTNPSSEKVSKAVVKVDFLKPNGKVVGSQTVEVSGIAPGSTKKVQVPDHNRGVSVRYRVVRVEN